MDETSEDLYENNTHPFVVKVWIEEPSTKTCRSTWRGHITHVPSGERRYMKKIGDASSFILPYLINMGVEIGLWERIKIKFCFGNRNNSNNS